MPNDDMELVGQYAAHQSESAFAEVVSRHANLVYSASLRLVSDPQLAEEVTQAVFVLLARKAGSLNQRTILPSWLYRAACFISKSALKQEFRRQRREQDAYMQSAVDAPKTEEAWKQISPLLEEGMLRLGQTDRDALVLRFFEDRSLKEVGAALGASEDAAKKRVNRALEKLRKFFTKRGVVSTAAIIAVALSANSVQAAPVGLANSITAAVLAKGAAAGRSTLTLIKGALKLMAWTKAKIAVVAGVGALLAVGTTTVAVKEIRAHETYSWQVRYADSRVLEAAPQQVAIVPSRYSESGGSVWVNQKMMGLGCSIKEVLQIAYGQSAWRTIYLCDMPQAKFDYIASLPSGNSAALQKEIRRKFGVATRRESKETDVLFLRIQSPHAPGLTPADSARRGPNEGASNRSGSGYFSMRDEPLSGLAGFLEGYFASPVIDQTGLSGHFDIDLKWDQTDFQHPNPEALKQVLLDQLGLGLVPGREAIEMLVVDKAP